MNIDNVKNLDWSNDFTYEAEFEFKKNEMYETSEGEYERDEEKYVHEEDYGFNDEGAAMSMSMSMKQNNDLNLYNRDQCRINALLYYAAIHGLGIRLHESGTEQDMFECTIHLTSQCVEAELSATFLCEEFCEAIFEFGTGRVEVFTEIAGTMECEYYSFSDAFQLIMDFIEFADTDKKVKLSR